MNLERENMMKFKKTMSILLLLLLIISLISCRKIQKIAKTHENGNTNGNIINLGLVASQGDWLYISILSKDSGKLIKMHSDGTEITVLNDDECMYLNVVNDWIYYRNWSDEGRLYKIHTDGTDRIKLSEDVVYYIHVVGDWIYYENDSDSGNLYKIRTDGSNRIKLTDDKDSPYLYTEQCMYVNVVGRWIYFRYYGDQRGNIYKIRSDGSERTLLISDNCYNPIVCGNWIYYCNHTYGGKLYKSSINRSEKTILTNDSVFNINVVGDWVFYNNESDENHLYKIRSDGTDRTKLNDDFSKNINIIGDWIYYENGSDNDAFYRIKTDGTNRQKFENQDSGKVAVIKKPAEEIKETETEDEEKEVETPTYTYGVWELSKPSDYVYEYPTNKSQWVKDPYKEINLCEICHRISRRYCDINQDGIPELFLSWSGGTGGSNYVVYQITKGDYRFLGNLDFFPSPQILHTKHNGFNDLLIFWRLGGNEKGEAEGVLSLLEFDGNKYKMIKEMNIYKEEAIKKKIFTPNTDKIFSHNYISDDDIETNKPWTREADDEYRKLIK